MPRNRLLDTFLELVRIDSPSGKEADVAEYCMRALRESGFVVRFDDTAALTGSNTGNLIATREGIGAGSLVLSAHMDCVQPCEGVEPVLDGDIITSAGDTVLGGDDKGGIAVILEAIRRLDESGSAAPSIRVIFTVSEETGLTGAKALASEDVTGDVCLVLDAEGEPGGIVVAAPTHFTFLAHFVGQAAHAGVSPEQGRSALLMASRAVCAMKHGRLDQQTTANIGSIEGGTATNVVAASATVTGECRSIDPDRAEEVREAMDTAMREAARSGHGNVDISWTREYVGFQFADDDPLLTLVEESMRAVSIDPKRFATGGGSDGNIFFADGVPTLVLSSGLRDVHSVDESVDLADMESLVQVVMEVARRLADDS